MLSNFQTETIVNPEVLPNPVNASEINEIETLNYQPEVCLNLYSRGLLDGLFSDISIRILGHTFKLHRLILIKLPYFESMLASDSQWTEKEQSTIDIQVDDPYITLDAVHLVFERIYGQSCCKFDIKKAMSILATSAFFGETGLAQHCLNVMIESLVTLDKPELVLDYVQFTESNCGKLTNDLMDALFYFLCLSGHKEEMIPMMAKLPEEWFQSIISSDYFFTRSEWERYKILRQMLQLRREKEANESSDTLVGPSDESLSEVEMVPNQPEKELAKKLTLDSTVIFAHLPFSALEMIEQEGLVQPHTLQKALWAQHSLKCKVMKANPTDENLNITYDIDSEHIESLKGNIQHLRVISLKKHFSFRLNDLKYPPFRFGVEFDNLRRLHSGTRLDSGSVFYAGSLWTLSIQKKLIDKKPTLGLFLNRDKGQGPTNTVSGPLEANGEKMPYMDARIKIRAWFKIFCYVNHRQCCVRESNSGLFEMSMGWGWNADDDLYQELGLDDLVPKKALTCCVVMGLI